MNVGEAYAIYEKGEPCESEETDIYCPNCLGRWSSRSESYSGVARTKYVGIEHLAPENINLDTSESDSYCPNGCTNDMGDRVILKLMCNVGVFSAHDEYQCAKLLVKKDRLSKRIDEINRDLETYIDF